MKKKLLYIGGPILLVIVAIYSYTAIGAITYSDGDRVGTVAKFSHKGLGIKTWEGELHMGGITEGGVPKVWHFSVDDEEVVKSIQDAQTWGGRVKLHYNEQMWTQSWRGSTPYFVVEVTKLEK
jgi:hypothetical protein